MRNMSFSSKCFSEPYNVSVGIHGDSGKRNAMVLQNLAWSNDFFGMVGHYLWRNKFLLQYQIAKKWMKLGKIF